MKAGIVVFPGTNRERDMEQALRLVSGKAPTMLWHRDTTLPDLDLIVLPGGFSFGDYLRSGAMGAHSPILSEVRAFAERGGYVLGVCNGFQILTEAQLLPGALLRNTGMRFLSQDGYLRVEAGDTAFTRDWSKGDVFRAPLAHGDGNYTASEASWIVSKGKSASRSAMFAPRAGWMRRAASAIPTEASAPLRVF